MTTIAAVMANGPQGTRVIVDASTGTFAGEKLNGTVHGPGGDWLTMRADGSMKLDVRIVLKTADGADILMTYTGVSTGLGNPIHTAPLFETGDERYAWLNTVQALAIGLAGPESVTYEVYRIV